MKSLFIIGSLFLIFAIPQVFADPLADQTALQQRFTIETGGYDFEVLTASNFEITDVGFSADSKQLTLYINSGLENNISEIQIPTNLINGNFTFFLNDQEIFPTVKGNEKISFIVVEFEGTGNHQLDIIGTTYLPEFAEIAPLILAASLIGIIFLKRKNKLTYS